MFGFEQPNKGHIQEKLKERKKKKIKNQMHKMHALALC